MRYPQKLFCNLVSRITETFFSYRRLVGKCRSHRKTVGAPVMQSSRGAKFDMNSAVFADILVMGPAELGVDLMLVLRTACMHVVDHCSLLMF
jgi:hypothetical protein